MMITRQQGEVHRLQVMDWSGDRSVEWDTADLKSLREAEKVFDEIKRRGQVFYAQPGGEGGGVVESFDPQADMIGVPAIVGG